MDFLHCVQISWRLRFELIVLIAFSAVQPALLGNLGEPVELAVTQKLAETAFSEATVNISPSRCLSSDEDLPGSAFFSPCSSFCIPRTVETNVELHERLRHLDHELGDRRETPGAQVERRSRRRSKIAQSKPYERNEANELEVHDWQNSSSINDRGSCAICLATMSRDAHEIEFTRSIPIDYGYTSSPTAKNHQGPECFTTLGCGHIYHPSCIGPWLKMHRTCPLCRADQQELTDHEETLSAGESSSDCSSYCLGEMSRQIESLTQLCITILILFVVLVVFDILYGVGVI